MMIVIIIIRLHKYVHCMAMVLDSLTVGTYAYA